MARSSDGLPRKAWERMALDPLHRNQSRRKESRDQEHGYLLSVQFLDASYAAGLFLGCRAQMS